MTALDPEVLDGVLALLGELKEDWDYEEAIDPRTRFIADLGLESLEIVVLATMIQQQYGKLPFPVFFDEIGQRPRRHHVNALELAIGGGSVARVEKQKRSIGVRHGCEPVVRIAREESDEHPIHDRARHVLRIRPRGADEREIVARGRRHGEARLGRRIVRTTACVRRGERNPRRRADERDVSEATSARTAPHDEHYTCPRPC